jgi:3'-phosphoadenosine 5'-phosphosulfate sulfotransferase (PAPS reductase)/FAD synthetase
MNSLPQKRGRVKRPSPSIVDSPVTTSHNPLTLLRNGAALVLSVSGGKDSDAMSHHLLDLRQREGWPGDVVMVHADLGRSEWFSTPKYVEELAARKGVPLHIVRRPAGDLIAHIWQRWDSVNHAACPWPSSAARYCTSDMNRGPIDTWLRNQFPENATIVCAQGVRAEESSSRAKALPVQEREDATARTKNRLVVDWLPLHAWKKADVWECIKTLGDNIYHPAYDRNPHTNIANDRLSCALCILANENDLLNGALQNPDVYREMCRIEAVTGYSFRQKKVKGVVRYWWLSDLQPALLPDETRTAVDAHKARLIEGKPIQVSLFGEVL